MVYCKLKMYGGLMKTDRFPWKVPKNTEFLFQREPPISVFRKRCSESMQQIYRRTSMTKYDFNKVAN